MDISSLPDAPQPSVNVESLPDAPAPSSGGKAKPVVVQKLEAVANQVEQETGIPASFGIAQATQESGRNGSTLSNNHNNWFGMKVGSSGKAGVSLPTTEYSDGQATTLPQNFRAYQSPEESYRDWAQKISTLPIYSKAYQAAKDRDFGRYAAEVASAGYSSDPNYASNLISTHTAIAPHVASVAGLPDAPPPAVENLPDAPALNNDPFSMKPPEDVLGRVKYYAHDLPTASAEYVREEGPKVLTDNPTAQKIAKFAAELVPATPYELARDMVVIPAAIGAGAGAIGVGGIAAARGAAKVASPMLGEAESGIAKAIRNMASKGMLEGAGETMAKPIRWVMGIDKVDVTELQKSLMESSPKDFAPIAEKLIADATVIPENLRGEVGISSEKLSELSNGIVKDSGQELSAPISSKDGTGWVNTIRRYMTSAKGQLEDAGALGIEWRNRFMRAIGAAEVKRGAQIDILREMHDGLSKVPGYTPEVLKANITDILSGTAKPLNNYTRNVATVMRGMLDNSFEEASRYHLTDTVKRIKNYFPRMQDYDLIEKLLDDPKAFKEFLVTDTAKELGMTEKASQILLEDAGARRTYLSDLSTDTGGRIREAAKKLGISKGSAASVLEDKGLSKEFLAGSDLAESDTAKRLAKRTGWSLEQAKYNLEHSAKILETRSQWYENPNLIKEDFVNKLIARQKVWDPIEGKDITMDRGRALHEIKLMLAHRKEIKFGGLEKEREIDSPFYIRDPFVAVNQYLDKSTRRIELARTFGVHNKFGFKLSSMVGATHGPEVETRFREVTNRLLGLDSGKGMTHEEGVISKKIRELTSTSLLGLSVIPNATQGFYGSAIKSGVMNAIRTTARAYMEEFGRLLGGDVGEMRRWAMKVGALQDDAIKSVAKTATPQNFLHKTGFSWVEDMNRIISANASKGYSDMMLGLIKKGKLNDEYTNVLARMGINKAEVAKRGFFNDAEKRLIANDFTNVTQGRARAIDLPLSFSTPFGRTFWHLQNFQFQWFRNMIKDEIYNQAKQGNFSPAINAIGVAVPMAGAPSVMLRNVITGKPVLTELKESDKPWGITTGNDTLDNAIANYLEWFSAIGGLGMGKMAVDLLFDKKLATPVPPMVSTPINILQGAKNATNHTISGDGEQAIQDMTKTTGRYLIPHLAARMPTPLVLPTVAAGRYFANNPQVVSDTYAELARAMAGR